MSYIFETERLRLREFILDDYPFVLALLNSPGWLRFIGDRNIKTAEQAKSYLQNGPMKSYLDNGFGLSLVEKKENNIAIGVCGIIKRDHLDYPDIGFAFLSDFCGKGYAFEIAVETLAYAKNILKLPKVCAITLADNEKSIRLLQKIGMHFIEPIRLLDDNEELQLYST